MNESDTLRESATRFSENVPVKVLLAYGEHGKNADGTQWNWCEGRELVGSFGFICASVCGCGCAMSFTGLRNLTATTHAVVAEMLSDDLLAARMRFYDHYKESWNGDEDIAVVACDSYAAMLEQLEQYDIGQVLCVEKNKSNYGEVTAVLIPQVQD